MMRKDVAFRQKSILKQISSKNHQRIMLSGSAKNAITNKGNSQRPRSTRNRLTPGRSSRAPSTARRSTRRPTMAETRKSSNSDEFEGICNKYMKAIYNRKLLIFAFIATFIAGMLIGSLFDFYGRFSHGKHHPVWRYDSQPAGINGNKMDKNHPVWKDFDATTSKQLEAAFQGGTARREIKHLKVRTGPNGEWNEYSFTWKTVGTQQPIVPNGHGGYRAKQHKNGRDMGPRSIKRVLQSQLSGE